MVSSFVTYIILKIHDLRKVLGQIVDQIQMPSNHGQVHQGERIGIAHSNIMLMLAVHESCHRFLVSIDHRLLQYTDILKIMWDLLEKASCLLAERCSSNQLVAIAVDHQLFEHGHVARVQGLLDALLDARLG